MSNEHGSASSHRSGDPARVREEPGDSALACPLPSRHGRSQATLASRELAALLAAAGAGDRGAFTEFYQLTSPRVFGLTVRILRSHAAAEEVTQEVYLQVWSMADRYDATLASPVGWIMMLAHRRAVDRVRSESSATSRDLVYAHEHLGRDHDVVAESVAQRIEEQQVAGCLETLTPTQREAIALAYYSGRTYREVADHLSVPLPTIKTRIRDGLKRLEKCLSGERTDG
ncbi:ECF RNA polymerase sigma factor SigK [Nocardia abscessus]|uniref:ECF RNA polymerase sigma factor SigK n=1 Tax=Nocardia abscessus TaxID=120957 RepID=UPI001E3A3EC9|nr:ECF RNA polymerase sigma factor SigK [Nocardia abscessus]